MTLGKDMSEPSKQREDEIFELTLRGGPQEKEATKFLKNSVCPYELHCFAKLYNWDGDISPVKLLIVHTGPWEPSVESPGNNDGTKSVSQGDSSPCSSLHNLKGCSQAADPPAPNRQVL